MFRVVWDKDINGVLLTTNGNGDALNVSPRPVFYEELSLLGFDKNWNWKYSESNEPLLWALDRRYFYKGELVAEVKCGNLFDDPKIEISGAGKNLKLKPINIQKVVEKNQKLLFLLEQEAIEFIEQTYRTYSLKKTASKAKANEEVDWALLAEMHEKNTKIKHAVVKQDCDSFDIMPLDLAKENNKTVYLITKIDQFIASFSGGKDSQVTLDLVSRVIPPNDFMVLYSDTGMEIPPSYDIWEKTKKQYNKQYPELKFFLAKNKQNTFDYWKMFGAPSRLHRWCCTVTKTAPLYRLIKEITGSEKQPNVFVYEGIRSEESNTRETYSRIGKGVKHNNVINARPIFNWTVTEVFLYLFKRHLPINEGYRNGLNRVGCSICPFSSEWSEHIINIKYPNSIDNQLTLLRNQLSQTGVSDVDNYIKTGNWKIRAGGRNTNIESSRIDIIQEKPNLIVIISNAKESFSEWIKTLGRVHYFNNNGKLQGEVFTKRKTINFEVIHNDDNSINKSKVIFSNIDGDSILISKIKKVLYKTTYCINCESCEVECPTGALKVVPKVTIDINKCTHCGRCYDFVDKGCLFAKSLNVSEGGKNMKNSKTNIDKYSGFGLREIWLNGFFQNINNYFEIEHGLGTKQVPAVINWLRDAELLNRADKNRSEIGLILAKLYNNKPNLVWELIWINLVYNSSIVNWYVSEINWNITLQKNELEATLFNSYPDFRERTLHNGLEALTNMFKESIIGNALEIGLVKKTGQTSFITKKSYEKVDVVTVAYSIYRYANSKNRYNLTVSELYAPEQKQGIYKEFGVSKERFQNILRTLQENINGIVKVDLVMGLDNISLREDLTYTEVLKFLLEK